MNYEQLKKDLIRHEALRLHPYLCSSDKLTIGVGRNLDDRGITEEEAMYLLDNDINICIRELMDNVPFYNRMPDDIKEILVNLTFNMGMPTLLKFQKMLGHVEAGRFEEASAELLNSRYAKQVKGRAVELASRMANVGA